MNEASTKVLSRSYFVYKSFKYFSINHHSLDIFFPYTKTIR